MLQTIVDTALSESLSEIKVETPAIGHDEIVQLIKGEKTETLLQVLFDRFASTVADRLADTVAERIIARMGSSLPSILASEPTEPISTTPIPVPVAEVELIVEPTLAPVPEVEISEEPSDSPAHSLSSKGKRILSEEVRKKIAESQKARWATRTRSLSPESKAKISESQRNRWAVKRGAVLPTPTSCEDDSPAGTPEQIKQEKGLQVSPPLEAVLATKEGYTGDSFYIGEDGHFIGEDGFVVPKDFDEFFTRYPKYIENWVRRRLKGYGVEEDIEDWCQDLIIHLKYLPPTSKHREEGKTDVFQTFDPFSQYGASERRWRNYINFCLANKYNTIHGKRAKNPVCRAGNLSLASETNPDVQGEVTDEYVYSKSEYLMTATAREEKKRGDQSFAQAFMEFVKQEDPDVLPILMAVYETGNSAAETTKGFCRTCQQLATTIELENHDHEGHEIGITVNEYNRAKNRLSQLGEIFTAKKKLRRKLMAKA